MVIVNAVTVFGVGALTFMMLMYALERRHRGFTLAFAAGCAPPRRGLTVCEPMFV